MEKTTKQPKTKITEGELTIMVREPTSNKRIKIMGNAFMITSKLKTEQIQKLEKYNRDALVLTRNDEEGFKEELFRISTKGAAEISNFGIVFNETDANGYATVTALFYDNTTDKIEFIKERVAPILFKLLEIEAIAKVAYAELENKLTEIENDIEEVA